MVTTTGGRGDVDLTAPVVGPADGRDESDGDDIEVIPDPAHPSSRGRMRVFLVAAFLVVLAAAAITVGVVSNRHAAPDRVSSVSKVRPRPPAESRPAHRRVAVKTPAKPHVSVPAASSAPTVPSTAVAVVPTPPAVTPPPVAAATAAPPVEPASVLSWSSTPAALTLKGGAHETFTVTVTNPTAGTVTLGVPLSCAPALLTKHGTAVSSVMCEQMVQVMSPHQTLTRQYTIYATDTGDASGRALAAGGYIARVENLYSVPVTVTAK